jgi:hypothetical protein
MDAPDMAPDVLDAARTIFDLDATHAYVGVRESARSRRGRSPGDHAAAPNATDAQLREHLHGRLGELSLGSARGGELVHEARRV